MKPIPRSRSDVKDVATTATSPRLNQFGSQGRSFDTESEARAWIPDWANDNPELDMRFQQPDGRTMDDYVVPGFSELVSAGKLIPTNAMTSTRRLLSPVAHCTVVTSEIYPWGNGWRANWVGAQVARRVRPSLPSYSPPYTAMTTEARAKAASGFMDVLTSASELHKTIEMIVGFKKRVRDMIRDLVRNWARVRGGKRVWKSFSEIFTDLSSFWLEYRYGWRILWYEYNSIVEVINAIKNDQVRRSFRVTEMLPTTETDRTETVLTSPIGLGFNSYTVGSGTARAGTTAKVDIRTHVQVDPLVTAWELLPLSFVLDWFWNIGDVLAANSPFTRVEEEDLWVSLERSGVTFGEWNILNVPSNIKVYRYEPQGAFWENLEKTRTPRKAGWSFPSSRINMSWAKALDMGSLFLVLRDSVFTELRGRSRV